MFYLVNGSPLIQAEFRRGLKDMHFGVRVLVLVAVVEMGLEIQEIIFIAVEEEDILRDQEAEDFVGLGAINMEAEKKNNFILRLSIINN